MIVCLCHGLNERAINAVIHEGAECVDDVTEACGAGGKCGSCRSAIASLIENYASNQVVSLYSAPSPTATAALNNEGATNAGTQGRHRAA
jgi:bacterioferritin-associated ferredoxin